MSPWMKSLRNLAWLTQLGFSLVSPLLLCLWGAVWLQQRFGLGTWVVLVGLVLGLGGAFSSVLAFYRFASGKKKKTQDEEKPTAFNDHS